MFKNGYCSRKSIRRCPPKKPWCSKFKLNIIIRNKYFLNFFKSHPRNASKSVRHVQDFQSTVEECFAQQINLIAAIRSFENLKILLHKKALIKYLEI